MILFSKTVNLYKPKDTKELQGIVTKYEKISIQGTKHSQGGQSKNPNKDKEIKAAVIDLKKFNKIELIDETNLNVTVQAGVKWKDLIKELNKKGLSPIVTQSDYDFAIGGALATNVHGWQAKSGPLISTVNNFQLINAKGEEITCSETKNPDIFKAAIGGYGLFGVITKVNLKITKNSTYQTHSSKIETKDFIETFDKDVLNKNETEMFYARLDVSDKNFLKNTIFNSYEKVDSCQAIEKSKMTNLRIKQFIINLIFSLVIFDFFKALRFKIECKMSEKSNGKILKRNDLFNNSVNDYITMHPLRVDILQEYFIPKDKFNEFITFLQSDDMKDLRRPLLNITLRHVKKDAKSTLNYAKNEDEIAFVMFFRGFKTKAFEEKIGELSRKMTDKAQELGGNYYLPYRPYQTKDQFDKGYGKKDDLVKLKKEKDPNSKFTNVFWENYLGPVEMGA